MLRQKLHEAFIEHNNSNFIPLDTLKEIVDVSAVLEEVQQNSAWQHLSQAQAVHVVQEAPKLFAILVLIAQSQTIITFLDAGLGDKDLPFGCIVGAKKSGVGGRLRLVPRDGVGSSLIDPFEHWQDRKLKDFEETQWVTLAPYFKADNKGSPVHYSLNAREVLPFIDESRNPSTPQGGYSTVWAVKIHPQHDGLQASVATVSKILNQMSKTDI